MRTEDRWPGQAKMATAPLEHTHTHTWAKMWAQACFQKHRQHEKQHQPPWHTTTFLPAFSVGRKPHEDSSTSLKGVWRLSFQDILHNTHTEIVGCASAVPLDGLRRPARSRGPRTPSTPPARRAMAAPAARPWAAPSTPIQYRPQNALLRVPPNSSSACPCLCASLVLWSLGRSILRYWAEAWAPQAPEKKAPPPSSGPRPMSASHVPTVP